MDEDGLMLNFSSTPTHNFSSTSLNGFKVSGNWKQRLKAKKAFQHTVQKRKTLTRDERSHQSVDAKKRHPNINLNKEDKDGVSSTETPKLTDSSQNHSAPTLIHGKPQVLSSLFSSNPAIPNAIKPSHTATKTPSNAPLDFKTFTGLGLASHLASHLSNRLGIASPTSIQRRAIPVLLDKSDKDVVVQSETGSGKTLTYLLPILHRMTMASVNVSRMSRSMGTLAIVLTPTRELATQVLDVVRTLLNAYSTYWIVPGLVIGGEKKKSEKARLRKGITILVCTPGRLLDHLKNTKSFDVRQLRWLVLDEADRLLELGFEETLKEILAALRGRSKFEDGLEGWPSRRQTVLCSATLRDDVKKLAGEGLMEPIFIGGAAEEEKGIEMKKRKYEDTETEEIGENIYSTPNQLRQKYVIVPAKLKLVTLVAVLRDFFKHELYKKAIVFLSSCDSVEFFHELFTHAGKKEAEEEEEEEEKEEERRKRIINSDSDEKSYRSKRMERKESNTVHNLKLSTVPKTKIPQDISTIGLILPDILLFKLHGDLPQVERTQIYHDFARASSGVLFCTDVAARGLDLPEVQIIVQYDPPCDLKDYVHRVGRTARLGRTGEALIMLLPSETEYLDVLKAQDIKPESMVVERILTQGLVEGKGNDFEAPATRLQNMMERWVLSSTKCMNLARKAYWSSTRAYATHSAAEKHIFHIKRLHLGHVAKSFALREAPSDITPSSVKEKRPSRAIPIATKKVKHLNTNDASEFAIGDVNELMAGPTTKRKKAKVK